MPDTDEDKKKLKGAFGEKGTQVNAISYGHPHGQQIMAEAYDVIRESEAGRLLLRLLDNRKVPVQIIRGTGESGFSPELMTIYLQVPGKVSHATPQFIVYLIKALNEAAQELAGYKTPDPSKDIMAYASFIHGRNLDAISEVCKVVKELTNSSHFSDLLDTLAELGLNRVYKAYIDGASRDELYTEYAEAYDQAREGV